MAYPTGTLAKVLDDVDRDIIQLKSFAQSQKARMAAGNVPSTIIFDTYIRLKQVRARLTAAASTPGIVDYAKTQKNDANLNVVTEFNGVLSAIDSVTTQIESTFPKDGSGFLLAQILESTGPVDREFNPTATAGLRTQLDNIINAIA